jgi:hypothetical protein
VSPGLSTYASLPGGPSKTCVSMLDSACWRTESAVVIAFSSFRAGRLDGERVGRFSPPGESLLSGWGESSLAVEHRRKIGISPGRLPRPGPPTDPDVRISRIRLLATRFRCATSDGMATWVPSRKVSDSVICVYTVFPLPWTQPGAQTLALCADPLHRTPFPRLTAPSSTRPTRHRLEIVGAMMVASGGVNDASRLRSEKPFKMVMEPNPHSIPSSAISGLALHEPCRRST